LENYEKATAMFEELGEEGRNSLLVGSWPALKSRVGRL
jgi:hypothetical protein